ncbi:hypothetical protein MBLNU230_g1566t1 [Neophaeotheca triangularis]
MAANGESDNMRAMGSSDSEVARTSTSKSTYQSAESSSKTFHSTHSFQSEGQQSRSSSSQFFQSGGQSGDFMSSQSFQHGGQIGDAMQSHFSEQGQRKGQTDRTSSSQSTQHASQQGIAYDDNSRQGSSQRRIDQLPPPDEEDVEREPASERTPLIPRDGDATEAPDQSRSDTSAHFLLSKVNHDNSKGSKRRWPSLVALVLLCIVVVLILVFAFLTPSMVQEYAQQAVVFEPTSLSIDSFTSSGVRARIQGDFTMDASRVEKKSVRDFGKFGTYIAREVESGESDVKVSLPEYGNVMLGTAQIPSIKVNIRNGHTTHVDFLSDLEPGDVGGIRKIANDWIDGRLGQLRVVGKASVPIKSGMLSFGTQNVIHELLFSNKDIPAIPSYEIGKLNVREVTIPTGKGMAAEVSLAVKNEYPVEFMIPPLGFGILVDGCAESQPQIMIADATTDSIHVRPEQDLELNVTGIVRQLPDNFTHECPGKGYSPMDTLLGRYINGKENTIYVRGSDAPSSETPRWVNDLMRDITVPVPLPGRTFGHLIRNFSMTETHFSLPDPLSDPKSPESNPRISSKIQALVSLPEEMNFNVSVGRVRAAAEVFFHGKKLGNLDLHKWQQANSTRIDKTEDEGPTLKVESLVDQAPLDVTDSDVFTDVLQAVLFGGEEVQLHIKADVDVELETAALGAVRVRDIPAEGEVPIKPIRKPQPPPDGDDAPGEPGNVPPSLRPTMHDLRIESTTHDSLTLTALVNMTNPTNYSATVPYINLNILTNNTLLGHAIARNLTILPGQNDNLPVSAIWSPTSSPESKAMGSEFLSQYISGYNTTLTIQTHADSIPHQPALGEALAKFNITLPTPSLRSTPPSDPSHPEPPEKEGPHFLNDATFHLLTSSATFILLSPLHYSTLLITDLNATAYYKGSPAGQILYDLPFMVPPVDEHGNGALTPRLPVDWSLGSVGYDAVKNALGGTLRLSAYAEVGVGIGHWRERVWFRGGGLGAKVRL